MASTRLGETLRSIQLLFSGQSVVGQSDAALLRRFVASRDEDAFGALVARHGPMVCSVCRDVLRDSHEVEDAFQATFLILVRRAGSLWVDESLGGWLYRVAYHVAIRANREASRRRTREQGGIDLAALPARSDDDQQAAELHDAIARLPERYRRPLVLCDLEGMPQLEAARVLDCGEATLRRRLAGARDRLRNRLAARGVPPLVLGRLGALGLIAQGALPAGFVEQTARVALGTREASVLATRLAGSAARASVFAKGVKVMFVAGLLSAAAAAYAFTRADDPRPPAAKAAPVPVNTVEDEPKVVPKTRAEPAQKVELVPVRWVHLKSDRGAEYWANLDTAIEFKREGKTVSMLDASTREWLTYRGSGAIEKSKPTPYHDMKDRLGRLITPAAHDIQDDPNRKVPSRTPPLLRLFRAVIASEYAFDTLDGKKTIRCDDYEHDALGAMRLQEQVWYDAETRRRLRSKKRYQAADQDRYGKEFETIDYDYPETGPADLAALGVPREAPIVDREATRRSSKWADQMPEVRKAIAGQVEAIRKFPRDLRVVSKGYRGEIHLEYWSVKEAFIDGFCKNMMSDVHRSLDDELTRYFKADNQDYGNRPDGLFPKISDAPTGAFDADRVALWFPFKKSVNVGLADGRMTYHLTRFSVEPDRPRDIEVHVMDHGFDGLPTFVEQHWAVARSRALGLEVLTPEAGTPPGMIVIKTNGTIQVGDRHEPYPQIYTLDPAHDWIAMRHVTWQKTYGRETWDLQDVRAKAFQQLANGSWYVSLWEKSETSGLEREKPTTKKPDRTRYMWVNIKTLQAEDFPKDIFNGPAFFEQAKKEGARVRAD